MKRASSHTMSDPDHARQTDQSAYSWCAHPAREQPGRAAVGTMWIVAVAAVVYATTFNVFWPTFAVVFLFAALNRFFFPTRFSLDDDGISSSSLLRWQRMRWADVRRFVHDEQGGLLSNRRRPSRLDAYRGMHVMFGKDAQQAVQAIEEQLRAARAAERTDSREPTTDAGGNG